uniref:Homing endonuclease LAGLIDADG domain-containing protein n=1 Tax=Stropharia rugosoannulata TaxID=68746 RepID=A0A3G9GXR4_9AGAR|nr:hypothetical protein [Stropharia rugosoannulata]
MNSVIPMSKKELLSHGVISPNSNLLKIYKEQLNSLSNEQWEASIGLILGDASLNTQNKGKTYRIKFEWNNKNKAYIDHVLNLFDEWIISEPHKKIRTSPNGKEVFNWGFQTISHQAFNPLAELFISNSKKTISNGLILNHLTSRGLAYWFMDDGGKLDYNKNSKNKSIVLNTQSFTDLEVTNLAEELHEKFKFKTSTSCPCEGGGGLRARVEITKVKK